ncbi:quinone oxidoreductase [Lactobacillus sp. 0.1XD8-4]|uniref:zinc-binding alcohol dehydrogenase family protein n=1 Tax=uncultured Limosilactobacillus sp. TaxID=2837629 RepID=UPI00129DAE07|nr:zinc-binding alcohol dehydrogenase family protein [uncultured Limosilactobacillus sp.]MRN06559.1 quinone oxidoreductase [Lactobacillus sp. 0.1XD8-4]
MKAVVIKKAGGPDQLIYQDVPTPKVRPGWSLVKVMGFGINHSEIFTRKGLSPTVKFPRILGIECVGLIEQTTDPKRLPKGQKVVSIMGEMGRAFDGSYAEYVLLPNEQIYPVETRLDWETLATIPETYYTAYGSLLNLRLQSGESVLVRGGSSGVGIAFMKLVRALFPDIRVTGTTRRSQKADQLISAGYDDVVFDQQDHLKTELKFDKIFELIGPATVKDSFKHTNPGGIVCSTGELGNKWYLEKFDPIMDIAPNSYLTSFYSGNVDQQKLNGLLRLISEKGVAVKPVKVFRLDQLPSAHRYLESHDSFGKVIVLNQADE